MSSGLLAALVVAFFALALAGVKTARGDARGADRATAAALVAMLVFVGFTIRDSFEAAGPLDDCRRVGGVQMVYVDDEWHCVPFPEGE